MCHSTEIEGHAFCSGLKHLDLSEAPAVQSRIKSAVYLIKDAVFRPKAVASSSDRFSLGIASLGQLVDMYHNREATDRQDKVYALLGMSSDDHIRADLMPDYRVSWKDLFYRLIRSLIGEVASVETWDDRETASIRSDVCVLGHISSVLEYEDDKQSVEIIFQDVLEPFAVREKLRAQHTLHASAKSIQVGDVICLLQGSSTPTIIRAYDDYCAIIAIAISLPDYFIIEEGSRKVITVFSWSNYFSDFRTFSHRCLLIWD
ncbi:hypothetical protein CDV31_005720 [Fusarium ambrosium]|uniref:Heterokaryon incompatibility domain-containing protein n=1 Tax=Fusarium ambrosium TaxID=131363 RepID=A0A428UHT9_9HYPO|nr:hypothetical protein CDV31_005720 [Fusarium ambrosium]